MNIRNEVALTLQVVRSSPRSGKDLKEYGAYIDGKGWGLKLSLMIPTELCPSSSLKPGTMLEILGSLEDATHPGAAPGQIAVRPTACKVLNGASDHAEEDQGVPPRTAGLPF